MQIKVAPLHRLHRLSSSSKKTRHFVGKVHIPALIFYDPLPSKISCRESTRLAISRNPCVWWLDVCVASQWHACVRFSSKVPSFERCSHSHTQSRLHFDIIRGSHCTGTLPHRNRNFFPSEFCVVCAVFGLLRKKRWVGGNWWENAKLRSGWEQLREFYYV